MYFLRIQIFINEYIISLKYFYEFSGTIISIYIMIKFFRKKIYFLAHESQKLIETKKSENGPMDWDASFGKENNVIYIDGVLQKEVLQKN